MQRLVEGVHYFHDIGFRQHKELFARLKNNQRPEACFITCADSRIVPNLITSSEPGQLFTLRNVGNIIPCYGTSNNGELAAVEYAIAVLGIQHIIICGHTGCGAMQQLVAPQTPSTPSIQQWLRHADSTEAIIREHYSALKGEALVSAAAEENVLVQLEHLRTLPIVSARLSSGAVQLHGWMYKIATGEVFAYDSEVGQFVKMSNPLSTTAAERSGPAERTNNHMQPVPRSTPFKKQRLKSKSA